jgi:hypothetical protein
MAPATGHDGDGRLSGAQLGLWRAQAVEAAISAQHASGPLSRENEFDVRRSTFDVERNRDSMSGPFTQRTNPHNVGSPSDLTSNVELRTSNAPSGLSGWAHNLVAAATGPLRGLDPAGVPPAWQEVLAWAGTPLALSGELQWKRDIDEDASIAAPLERDGRLILPPPQRLAESTGPGLKPLRLFIASRLHLRLQSAPGLRLWLWQDRVLLVSCRDEPVGGFVYAPTLQQRHSVLLESGGWQVIRW